jgi:hypothetical protein
MYLSIYWKSILEIKMQAIYKYSEDKSSVKT